MAGVKGEKYKVTKADKQTVKNLALLGCKHEEIAACIGIQGVSLTTLEKYYSKDLQLYARQILGQIARNAFQQALSGDKTMIIFILKCRAGWKENDAVTLNGKVELVKRVVGVDDDAV